ncbi:MAG: Crp/Fnr family transcriptional regulator [Gemmatimonadaceae bacterium]
MATRSGKPARVAIDSAAIKGDVGGRDGSRQNLLLARLPPSELAAVAQRGEEINLKTREVLFENGDELEHIYFPLTAMISLLTVLGDGTSIEAITIGHEGIVGLPLFHGVARSQARGVCQVEGALYRIPARELPGLLEQSPTLTKKLHCYSQFANDAMAQSAACNSIHLVEQRCARWLLLTADAVGNDSFTLTQEFLAQMLAVRRSGVTVAMGGLERQSLIATRYGGVTIADKEGLAKISCECYKTISDRRRELIG